MFSLLNNKKNIEFMFSEELKNDLGEYLSKGFLQKGEFILGKEDLEIMVRRSIFPNMTRKNKVKLSLKIFRVIYDLSKREMVDYDATQSEEWKIYGSDSDLIKVNIYKNKLVNEKLKRVNYMSLPTYFPLYLRSTV
jgi:hypothetical protein